jgi:hypothetical protein
MNQLIEAFHGKLGDLVFRQMPDGSVVVSRVPRYDKRKATPKQKAHRQRFRESASYGRWAAKYHTIYAELAEGTEKSAYNFAVSDWFNPPVIHRIERREGRILVEACDNIKVTKVRVTVLDDEGQVLEKGEAVRGAGDWWEFACQSEGKRIMAEAWDLPGHLTQLVV